MMDRLQNINRAVLWPTYLDSHSLHGGRKQLLLLGNKHFFLIAEAMRKGPSLPIPDKVLPLHFSPALSSLAKHNWLVPQFQT